MARRAVADSRFGVLQVPPFRADRRERRLLREPPQTNTKPEIVAELRKWRGRAIPLEGEQVFDIAKDLHRKYIDVEIEVEFRRGPYAGTRSWDTKRFRVVGVRNEDADNYHFYITNLPQEWLLPADIATIYRCRWMVKLLFRELKTLYDLDEFDTTNPAVVEILLYAAVLTLLVSRELLELMIEHADDEAVFHRKLGGDLSVARPAHPSRNRRWLRLSTAKYW